jgi:hypothetical protein
MVFYQKSLSDRDRMYSERLKVRFPSTCLRNLICRKYTEQAKGWCVRFVVFPSWLKDFVQYDEACLEVEAYRQKQVRLSFLRPEDNHPFDCRVILVINMPIAQRNNTNNSKLICSMAKSEITSFNVASHYQHFRQLIPDLDGHR